MRNSRKLHRHLAAAATAVVVTTGVSVSATAFVLTGHARSTSQKHWLATNKHVNYWQSWKATAAATLTSWTYNLSIHRTQLDAVAARFRVDDTSSSNRTYQTSADHYFQKHQCIPRPSVMHASLPISKQSATSSSKSSREKEPIGILVIGDVHGCFDELMLLHEKAIHQNQGRPFQYVILVGDLVNKGPKSLQVVRYARNQPNWYSVRGNHDDGALAAALGDDRRRTQPKYQWILGGLDHHDCLSDEDIEWLAELPYTLRIPRQILGTLEDTMIVHAGFVPGVELEKQEIDNMINLRTVKPALDKANIDSWTASSSKSDRPWASIYSGPEHVIFGHDARRGLQRQAFATGLDTGACYGKKLTGLILPSHTLVSVDSLAEHSHIGSQSSGSKQ